MKKLFPILFAFLSTVSIYAQPGQGPRGSVVEVAGGPAILKKPPVYKSYSPCQVIFENYTRTPLQVNVVRPDGKLVRMFYIAARDTIKFESTTNVHHIVVHNGFTTGPMYIPYGDVNICKIHDSHFHAGQRINPKMYADEDDGFKELKFKFKNRLVTYGRGKGPIIYFDQAHLNRFRITDRFKPIADMLSGDGYQVKSYFQPFTDKGLKTGKILVMANAVAPSVNGWRVDSAQAITREELVALKNWVTEGGRLLLIADEMPYPSRIKTVAEAFGFEFQNNMVRDTSAREMGDIFSEGLKSLGKHVIFEGRNDNEIVDQVVTFGGCAIKAPEKAKPLLTYDNRFVAFYPKYPNQIESSTEQHSAEGLLMGATLDYGSGKIVVLGDIHLMCALKHGRTGQKAGMNHKYATKNALFVMNMFHWLDGFIE